MRLKFVLVGGKLVPWPEVEAARRALAAATQSHLPGPMIICDTLDGVVNPCDGKPYYSKSAYYKAVKNAGCVIVGDEAEKLAPVSPPAEHKTVTARDIVDAIEKVEAGYKPQTVPLEQFDAS